MARTNNMKERQVRITKVAPQKIYDYIKKLEIDGLPRVRAYAEAIDPKIYDLNPAQMARKLDCIKRDYPGYEEIREMVLAENKEWALRRSEAIQNKALDLLGNLLDKANDIAKDPEADVKELNVAVSTLKSIMPAFAAIGNKTNMNTDTKDRTARAAGYIN